MGVRNPLFCPWRSQLALALGGGEEASTLAAHELAHARAAGPGRGVAVALRAQAALASGCDAVGLLEQALTALEDSPARLERALVLAELGGALRRSGELIRARSRLREAQDLATRCGAAGLAEQTLAELRLSGARPRRPWVTGVAALTAGELRVAQLAARGLSNAQIAAELMISVKTVKHHLSAAFRKLDIDGRRGLDPEALTAASNEEPARSALR
jgi:DNA-binding CsgD family transcriptional regulator